MSLTNNNIFSLSAQVTLNSNARAISTVMQQLSTGKRINNPSDDVAGLAISTRLTTQIRGLNQALRNGNDGISLIQTADSGASEIGNMLQRMREVAIDAYSKTNATDASIVDVDYSALKTQITQTAESAQWAGSNLLTSGVYTFQIGANAGQTIAVTLPDMRINSGSKLSSILDSQVTDSTSASAAQGLLSAALDIVNLERANMGAVISRLQFNNDNLLNLSLRIQESRSRIEDTDYAQASTELARRLIIQQAAQAMLAQSNQMPALVLQLIR